jgi:hypothetical protein
MVPAGNANSPEQLELLRWSVRFGVITAEAVAEHGGWTLASARGRLQAAERAGLLRSRRILADAPALYTATRAGLRVAGLRGLGTCRVSVAGAPHAIACAEVAAALERIYPDHRVTGERELRRDEREAGTALASACLGRRPGAAAMLHRPDLVLWPQGTDEQLPVAVEVELTIKAPQRLLDICRAWARCDCVAGVLYLAAPEVRPALARAIERAQAGERIALVGLDALTCREQRLASTAASTVPSDA